MTNRIFKGNFPFALGFQLNALQSGGCTRVALWVLASNAPAIGYYQARGFRDTGLTQGNGPLQERQMLLSPLH